MSRIKRHGVSELDKPLNDEHWLRAADSVREFAKSDGMFVFQHELEKRRKYVTQEFINAAGTSHLRLAEIGGMLKMIEDVYQIFDHIQIVAERFER